MWPRPSTEACGTRPRAWASLDGSTPKQDKPPHIPLGVGSRPHGVIVGPDGEAWITDSGLNAIVRVDPLTGDVVQFQLPSDRPDANLNTAAFDSTGRLWFTGQNGIHGVLDPTSELMEVFDSPRGRGPYASRPHRSARSITPPSPGATLGWWPLTGQSQR